MSNKLKKFTLTAELLLFLTSGKFEVIGNALPDDTRLEKIYFEAGLIVMIISSSVFEEVPGDEIPFAASPVIKRIN